jgi:hypothetical protein
MTGSEKWGVIFEGQEGQELQVPGVDRRATPTKTPVFERDREGEGEKVGPIVGVYSLTTSTEESIKIYEGRNRYNMWKFVLKEESPVRPGRGPDEDEGPQTTRTPRYPTTRTPNY